MILIIMDMKVKHQAKAQGKLLFKFKPMLA